MTENSLLKAKIDLYNIISNFSRRDYIQANYRNGKKISNKNLPYSSSFETLEATEIYHIVYAKKSEDITPEQEEIIKSYLLLFRTFKTGYIEDAGGREYYKNSIQKFECKYLESENCDLARHLKVCSNSKCNNFNNKYTGILA